VIKVEEIYILCGGMCEPYSAVYRGIYPILKIWNQAILLCLSQYIIYTYSSHVWLWLWPFWFL